jgi:hypothetical protein
MFDDHTDQQRVERDLRRTRAAWSSVAGRRDKMDYLETVFNIGENWKREQKGIRYQSLMLKLAGLNLGKRQRGRFKILIYCSSDPKNESDFRVRQKWVQWLDDASEKIKSGQTLREFVEERDGSISDAPPR